MVVISPDPDLADAQDGHALDQAERSRSLRKAAMGKNLKIVEVAQRMLDVADLLG